MRRRRAITLHSDEPLVGVIVEEDGRELVRYFPEETAAPAASDDDIRTALRAIGSSGDLDWESWADELDRIRHESEPTPPIDL